MANLLENYGIYTFNDDVMKERVSVETYKEFHRALEQGEPLSKEIASIIAEAMKKLQEAPVKEVVVTNTVPKKENAIPKIKQLDMSSQIADAIKHISYCA